MTVPADESRTPADSGLQAERTALAWVRTTLAFMVGAVIMTRLLAQQNVLLAIANAVLTLPLGVAVTWLSWRRHLRSERSIRTERPLPDAMLPAAVAALAVFVGTSGLVYSIIES